MQTILLVDDELDMLKILTMRLTHEGYKIEQEGDGSKVTQRVKDLKPDLVIIDYYLAGQDGAEICKELKSDEESKDVSIILYTAAKDKVEDEGFKDIADAVLSKPFSKEELLSTIKRILASKRKPRVLLIEDDMLIAKLVLFKLEKEGFDTSWKDNGLDGLNEAKASKPDIVLIDIMIPKLDGFGVLEGLKADPDTGSIYTMFLTALGNEEKIEKAFNMGVDDYLTKPFLPAELIRRINKILEEK